MSFETILTATDDGVTTITLNRPERMNAWNPTMAAELSTALEAAEADDAVRVVVLTGQGRAFCAGADLGEGEDTFRKVDDTNPHIAGTPATMPWDISKPVVTAINGHAIGVGMTFPMTTDLRFVAENAKMQFAFVRRGILPELGSLSLLERIVGRQVASDLLMSGRMFTGAEAKEMGLVARALPTEEVLPAALEWAHDVAANTAPVSVAATKQLMWEGARAEAEEMFQRETRLLPWFGGQPDAAEGVMSFLEKRRPAWSMRPTQDMPEL
ncbi:MAG: enoyl-CoA hydratase-related protein [Actinomycetota bacterium]|nr:enoyl-CoA hydratase-related protein [Actinomycetota bacterium]